jgi:ABC-type Fe3+ transport system substrate-binding protein
MRYVSVILFVLVLAAPFALRKALVPRTQTGMGHQAGAERLVIVTPHTSDIRNEFARAFSAWHRDRYGSDVEIDYRVPGGSSDVKRLLDTTYRAKRDDSPADISLVWGGGDYFMERELKPLGVLQPLRMSAARLAEFRAAFPQATLAGVKLYEAGKAADGKPAPLWVGVCLSSFGICYNPDVYRALQLPEPSPQRGWEDLTNPRLAGFIALADPAHSGSSAVAYQMVIQHQMDLAEKGLSDPNSPLYSPELAKAPRDKWKASPIYRAAIARGWKAGMAELLKIAANARYFTDSSTLVPMDVSRGEAAAGMAIDFYARVTEETVGSARMRYIAPIGATAITPDPIAILRGTKDRPLALAEHFIEFLLTPQAQRLWDLQPGTPGGPAGRSLRRMPIRQDVYRDRTGWADNINPFETANGFNQRGEWMALFGDSRPIWVAAWIDSRDDLKSAYRTILRIPDGPRRSALLEKLADLPIEMADVEAVQNERKRLEQSKGELDEWRARQQIDWAAKFRRHYRTVSEEAR